MTPSTDTALIEEREQLRVEVLRVMRRNPMMSDVALAIEIADALSRRVEGEGWRPEVRAFADLMERELRANDHKGGWKGEDPRPLMDRLWEEAHELSVYFGPGSRAGINTWREQIGAEAADVANFAMMIADVCGALTPPASSSGEG